MAIEAEATVAVAATEVAVAATEAAGATMGAASVAAVKVADLHNQEELCPAKEWAALCPGLSQNAANGSVLRISADRKDSATVSERSTRIEPSVGTSAAQLPAVLSDRGCLFLKEFLIRALYVKVPGQISGWRKGKQQ